MRYLYNLTKVAQKSKPHTHTCTTPPKRRNLTGIPPVLSSLFTFSANGAPAGDGVSAGGEDGDGDGAGGESDGEKGSLEPSCGGEWAAKETVKRSVIIKVLMMMMIDILLDLMYIWFRV